MPLALFLEFLAEVGAPVISRLLAQLGTLAGADTVVELLKGKTLKQITEEDKDAILKALLAFKSWFNGKELNTQERMNNIPDWKAIEDDLKKRGVSVRMLEQKYGGGSGSNVVDISSPSGRVTQMANDLILVSEVLFGGATLYSIDASLEFLDSVKRIQEATPELIQQGRSIRASLAG